MRYYLHHFDKGWLHLENGVVSWKEVYYHGTLFEGNEVGLALLSIGHWGVTLLPETRNIPARYAAPEPLSFDVDQDYISWLIERLKPFWTGEGNAFWFVDLDDQSYGPINEHELGGYTNPSSTERYQSVIMAAAAMMEEIYSARR